LRHGDDRTDVTKYKPGWQRHAERHAYLAAMIDLQVSKYPLVSGYVQIKRYAAGCGPWFQIQQHNPSWNLAFQYDLATLFRPPEWFTNG